VLGTTRRYLVRFPTGSTPELVIVCFGALIVLILAAATQYSPSEMRKKLILEMREIAREPLPDPRSRKLWHWDMKERYVQN